MVQYKRSKPSVLVRKEKKMAVLKKSHDDEPIDVEWSFVDDDEDNRKTRLRFLGGLVLGIFNILKKILSKIVTKRQIWSLVNGMIVWWVNASSLNFVFRKTFISDILGIFPHIKVLSLIKGIVFLAILISALFASAKNRQGMAMVILILSAVPLVIAGKMGIIMLFLLGGIVISIFAETSTTGGEKKNKKTE